MRRTEDGDIERGRSGGAERLSELGLVAEQSAASPFYRRGGQRWHCARTDGKDDGRGLRQLVINANSGSTEGVRAEAAKPARALQRRG